MRFVILVIVLVVSSCGPSDNRELETCLRLEDLFRGRYNVQMDRSELRYLDSLIQVSCSRPDSSEELCSILRHSRKKLRRAIDSTTQDGSSGDLNLFGRLAMKAIADSSCISDEIMMISKGPDHEPASFSTAIAILKEDIYESHCFGLDGRGIQYYGSTKVLRTQVNEVFDAEMIQRECYPDSSNYYINYRWARIRNDSFSARSVTSACDNQMAAIDSLFFRNRSHDPVVVQ